LPSSNSVEFSFFNCAVDYVFNKLFQPSSVHTYNEHLINSILFPQNLQYLLFYHIATSNQNSALILEEPGTGKSHTLEMYQAGKDNSVSLLTTLCSRVSNPDSIISGHLDAAEYYVIENQSSKLIYDDIILVADEIGLANLNKPISLERFHDPLENGIPIYTKNNEFSKYIKVPCILLSNFKVDPAILGKITLFTSVFHSRNDIQFSFAFHC
jgi:hypothetical protein